MRHAIAALALIGAAQLAACAAAPMPEPEAPAVAAPAEDAALRAAIDAPWRPDADKARDQYRHPAESLAFFGLAPNMTVVEISPGGGAWWTPILAHYAKLTGGAYIAGFNDLSGANVSDNARAARARFVERFADENLYGKIQVVDFGANAGLALPDASADLILTARNVHNWAVGDNPQAARYFAEFARVLKPGGVLAVKDHRAPEGADPRAGTGYLPESFVIGLAEAAGLQLAARSEINANPADDHDHPFGVWTLPPVRRTAPAGQPDDPNFDRAPYDAIGESDRMTLRFVKPAP